jgi:hypothetical protein
MPQQVYCWRCQIEIPMLDEGEWSQLAPLLTHATKEMKNFRGRTGASLEVTMQQGIQRPALDKYQELTGFEETNFNALWHHRLAQYGPPCEKCGKLMRTEVARFCAECGHVPTNKSLERTREG